MTHFRKRQSRRKTKTLINLQGGIKWGMGFEKEVLFKRAGVV